MAVTRTVAPAPARMDRPIVALTLDDGPTAGFTGEVLAILDEFDVTATFCVTGGEVTENPQEARAIIAAGHELGNHSYSHPRMVLKSYTPKRDRGDRCGHSRHRL